MEEQPNKREDGEDRRGCKPRIYVTSLSDYNAGHLHGAWIDADREVDEMEKDITLILASSPEPIRPYVQIDIAGFARDLELGGDVISVKAPDGSVWVFDGDG